MNLYIGRRKSYSEHMRDSLGTKPIKHRFDKIAHDPSYHAVNESMRDVVAMAPSARDYEIFLRHERIKNEWIDAGIRENISYTTGNTYHLFAVEVSDSAERDLQPFIALVNTYAKGIYPKREYVPYILWQLEFWPAQKELLAHAYACLLWIEAHDIFDAHWRIKFSEEYMKECLKRNGILNSDGPDLVKIERIFSGMN